MSSLHNEILADMAVIREDIGYPMFTWIDGNSYSCIASVSQYNRELGDGGYSTGLLLTMTVPRYGSDGYPVFPGDVIPEPQQRITFNNNQYRIEMVKQDSVYESSDGLTSSNGARLRIIAVSVTKGIV